MSHDIVSSVDPLIDGQVSASAKPRGDPGLSAENTLADRYRAPESTLGLRGPFGPKRPHHRARLPHFAGRNLLQLLLELLAVVLAAVRFKDATCFVAAGDLVVEFLEHRLGSV